jgi:hypothetical protein
MVFATREPIDDDAARVAECSSICPRTAVRVERVLRFLRFRPLGWIAEQLH